MTTFLHGAEVLEPGNTETAAAQDALAEAAAAFPYPPALLAEDGSTLLLETGGRLLLAS